jgi:hypothetical protein
MQTLLGGFLFLYKGIGGFFLGLFTEWFLIAFTLPGGLLSSFEFIFHMSISQI